MRPLRILMSAYACEPGKGSEPGVGWHWAQEMAALGHAVWVITRANNEAGILHSLAQEGMARHGGANNLHFIYYDLPPWARWWKRGGRGVHLYYMLWQWGAYRRAQALHAAQEFDAVHHITFGVTRHPSFMGRLGIPFILGPLGGGEWAPVPLRKYYSTSGRIRDGLRDGVNALARFDPWVRQTYAQASLILLKTPQSMDWLPAQYRHKARCMLEIGIDNRGAPLSPPATTSAHRRQALQLLYVGRFIHWKGMDLGLRAVAELRARGVPVRLTMIGQGPEQQRWQLLTAKLGLGDGVTWVPWMRQQDLLDAYQTFDALLFPSMHDSSGNVALESLAAGLPVVCLELGGPAELVDASCGRVIPVAGLDAEQVIAALTDALAELASSPLLVRKLGIGARRRAGEYSWRNVVSQVWGERGNGYKAVIDHAKADTVYASA